MTKIRLKQARLEDIIPDGQLFNHLETIAALWGDALLTLQSSSPDAFPLATLRDLTERTLFLLSAAEPDDAAAEEIGTALIHLGFDDLATLARTQEIWLEQFPRLLNASILIQVYPRLAHFVCGLAVGYSRQLAKTFGVNRAEQTRALVAQLRDLVEVRTAELAAATKELYLRVHIVDNLYYAVIVTDAERKIIDWNPGATRMFGYSRKEVIGRTAQFLYTEPQAWLPWQEQIERIERAGVYVDETPFVRKDGSVGITETSFVVLRDEIGTPVGIIGVNRDITASKQAEEQLRFQSNLLVQLNDALIVLDRNNRITHWLGGTERIYGIKEQDALGHRQDELYRYEYLDPNALDQAYAQLPTMGWWHGETKIYRPDGGIRYVDSYVRRLKDARGKTQGLFAIARDITEQKNLIADIEWRNNELQALNEIADALSETLDTDKILQMIAEYATKLTNAAGTYIRVPNDMGTEFISRAQVLPFHDAFDGSIPSHSIAGWVYQHREALNLAHMRDHPWLFAAEGDEKSSDNAGIFIPLLHGEDNFGVIVSVRPDDKPFTEREVKLMRIFASHAAVALNNARLFQDSQKRLNELAALEELSRLCSSSLDPRQIVEAGAEKAHQLLNADQCGIRLIEGDSLVPGARRGKIDDPEFEQVIPIRPLFQSVAEAGTEVIIGQRDDPQVTSGWKRRLEANGMQSLLILPLRVGGATLGILAAASIKANAWREEEISLARNISHTVAIALHNALQYQDIAKRASILAEFSELSVQLASSLDPTAIMRSACQRVLQVLGGARSSIRLADDQMLGFGISVGSHPPETRMHPIRIDDPLHSILDRKQPLVIHNVHHDMQIPARRPPQGFEAESGAFLGVPMQAEEDIIGILSVARAQPHHWTAEEISFVTAVGNVTALALEKARHHTRALGESERFRGIVQSSQAGLFMLNRVGHITFWNQAAQRISGWHIDRAMELNWANLFLDAEGHSSNLFAQLASSQTPLHEQNNLLLRTAERGAIPIDLGLAPMHDQVGQFVGAVGAFTDLSQLREALGIREEFLLNATHDLLSPLSVLLPSLDMFADPKLSRAKRAKARELIAVEVSRLERFAETYMNLDRPDAGLNLNITSYDLVPMVTRILGEFRKMESKHHFTFRSDAPSIIVSADGKRLESVLSNIYSNAVKYSPHGGNIHTTIGRHGRVVQLAVQDEGVGIPLEELEHIFERWRRPRTVDGQFVSGHRVGLSLVKKNVTAMGGRTWVESDGQHGSTFFVELPGETEADDG